MPCSIIYSMTLQTLSLSKETSDFLKEIHFLKPFNSVFHCFDFNLRTQIVKLFLSIIIIINTGIIVSIIII